MKLTASGFCPLTPQMQALIAEVDKPKMGGQKGSKMGEKKTTDKEGPSATVKSTTKRKTKTVPSTSSPKKRKQPARKRKSPTPSESESLESESQSVDRNEQEPPIRNEEEESARNKDATSNPEVTPIYNDIFISPPCSPKHTTIPITIAPFPHPVSNKPQSTIPLSTPLYTDSTVPPKTSREPVVSVNTSDAGAKTSGFTSSHISPPISPIYRADPDMIYGDDEDDLAGFTFSLITIRAASDDEASITKGQLKAINEKLDSLLQACKPSSSDEYSQASVKYILEILTKEHSYNREKMNKVVDASTSVCKETTKKVDKLISYAIAFMKTFQSSFETNTTGANEEIANVGSSLKIERSKLQEVQTGITSDHKAFKSSISS
ncbi:unnamed protein product [Lactuca saligna]|uniref:Uncharacterized protein n=1 Tax=Lactuca saligna TaxID=75948 RepID=A0AA35YME3_LACSI|nr:unnamed protein product [Lactuca saligna]